VRAEVAGRNAAARRSARLHGLYALVRPRAFAHAVDHVLERRAESQFHETGVAYFSHQAEYFRPRAFLRADGKERLGTHAHDNGDVAPGFHVVDVGGAAQVAFLRGIRRSRKRPAGLAFGAGDKGRFLAADERARAAYHVDLERKIAAHHACAQDSGGFRVFDGFLESLYGQGVFGADVHEAFGRAHGVRADYHALEQHVRVALDLVAVHVRARVALVGVTDYVLLVCLVLAHHLPFYAGGESRAAAAAQIGLGHGLHDLVGAHGADRLEQRAVAAYGHVFLDAFGVDHSAVAQYEFFLPLEEGDLVPFGYVFPGFSELDLGRPEVPAAYLGARGLGELLERRRILGGLDELRGRRGFYFGKHEHGFARRIQHEEGFLGTEAETARALDGDAGFLGGFLQSLEKLECADSDTAGTQAD